MPGSETDAASELLERAGFGDRAGFTGQLVVHAPDGVDGEAVTSDLRRLTDGMRAAVPDVGVRSPLEAGGESQISEDGTFAFVELDFGDIALHDAEELAADIAP